MKRIRLLFVWACIAAVLLTACTPSVKQNDFLDAAPIIGAVGQEILLAVDNPSGALLTAECSDPALASVIVSDGYTAVTVQLLKEGKGEIAFTLNGHTQSLSVSCFDLKLTVDTDHLDVGQSLTLTLSHDVAASFSVEGEGAEISGNRLTAVAEGAFSVIVRYGNIRLAYAMDSYARDARLTSLERDNPYIRYYGRNVHQENTVIMNNIGSGFEVTFWGTALYADLSGWYGSWYGITRLSVLVDGATDTTEHVIGLDKATTRSEYTLVSGLQEGWHTVKVLKRTEAISTSMTLYGLHTDGYFRRMEEQPQQLKIEAYGDSITAGYGNLRPDPYQDGTNSEYQDGLQTWATYTAWALDAQINVQARSGIGMYTSANVDDAQQVNSGYRYTTYDQQALWNFDNYTPDIVLINLGTNDYWNGTAFHEETFIEQYIAFVENLARIYGEDTAFILVSGLMERGVDAFVRQIATQLRTRIPNTVIRYQFKQCTAGHPMAAEQLAASEELVELIYSAGLDTPKQKSPGDEPVADAGDAQVDVTLNASLTDELPAHVGLWVKLDGELREMERVDALHYTLALRLKEGDYDVSFCLEGKEAYAESAKSHLLRVREKTAVYTLTPGAFANVPINENPYPETNGWHMSTALFPASFTTDGDDSVSLTNASNWMAAFVTRRSIVADGYRLSVDIRTQARVGESVYIGVIPYYVDDLNYVVCYLQFQSDGKLKSIGCTGASNGVSLGWLDFWDFAGTSVDLQAGVHMEFVRDGQNLTVKLNGITQTQAIGKMRADSAQVGVWSLCGGVVEYTAFCQQEKA